MEPRVNHHNRRIVALNGRAGSGKSEVAQYLVRRHGYTLLKFAEPLKAMIATYYRLVHGANEEAIEAVIEGHLKEEPTAMLEGKTTRWAMQTLGTEWGRKCIGESFWVNSWAHRVERTEGDIVVDDLRFNNEAEKVLNLGGTVYHVSRPMVGMAASGLHSSEDGISVNLIDHTISNSGDLLELMNALDNIKFS